MSSIDKKFMNLHVGHAYTSRKSLSALSTSAKTVKIRRKKESVVYKARLFLCKLNVERFATIHQVSFLIGNYLNARWSFGAY